MGFNSAFKGSISDVSTSVCFQGNGRGCDVNRAFIHNGILAPVTCYKSSGFNISIESARLPVDVPGVEWHLHFALCVGSRFSSRESALLRCKIESLAVRVSHTS
jgi:hypothetical protein